jgi:hypothetical protein
LCDSISGVTAFAGRRWGVGLEINKNISNPYLILSLGNPLTRILGDLDPKTDGGYYDGDGQDPCPLPFLYDGVISEPQFVVGEGLVLVNIKNMGVGEHWDTVARLIFKDAKGLTYHLFWGSGLMPGGFRLTNESAPDVYVVRNADEDEGGKRNWYVTTNAEEEGPPREGLHTAFLWKLSKPWTFDYCGAFDVSFSYTAIEE